MRDLNKMCYLCAEVDPLASLRMGAERCARCVYALLCFPKGWGAVHAALSRTSDGPSLLAPGDFLSLPLAPALGSRSVKGEGLRLPRSLSWKRL